VDDHTWWDEEHGGEDFASGRPDVQKYIQLGRRTSEMDTPQALNWGWIEDTNTDRYNPL